MDYKLVDVSVQGVLKKKGGGVGSCQPVSSIFWQLKYKLFLWL